MSFAAIEFIFIFCVDISHHTDVLDQLDEFPKDKWMEFGRECGLHYRTLRALEANYPRDVDRCFSECVARWLERKDDVDRRGKPTPQRLTEIRSKLGKEGQY